LCEIIYEDMRLQQNSLRERTFVLQCVEVLNAFGKYDIPWLRDLHELMYITNPKQFERKFKESMGIEMDDDVVPHTLVSSGSERNYVGGMWHFSKSPERFESASLKRICKDLETDLYAYMTCLHVRGILQGRRYGTELFSKVLQTIMKKYPNAWGVVSEPELLHWYQYFGGVVQNCMSDNAEGLAIVTFDERTIRRIK